MRRRSCGLVGLPSAGKSTLVNALTSSDVATVGNFPFTTISTQTADVSFPDARLSQLAAIFPSERVVPELLRFVDIAGLVEGASEGKGMGSRFLSDVRSVSALLHVVRCFKEDDVIHVRSESGETLNPMLDIAVIEQELLLADLSSVEKRLAGRKKAKTEEEEVEEGLLRQCLAVLEEGLPARAVLARRRGEEVAGASSSSSSSSSPSSPLSASSSFDSALEADVWGRLQLLTQKPVVFVCNVGEDGGGEEWVEEVREYGAQQGCEVVQLCAKMEAEAAAFESEEEKQEFLEMAGVEVSGLEVVGAAAKRALGESTFFTVGPQEARAWTIPSQASAVEAASKIHSDIAQKFVKAEVVSFQDYVDCGGEAEAKKRGLLRVEGKEYAVQDGDVIHFKHAA